MVLKILLTGGAGYIGSSVANLLIDRGHKVVVIDNLITGDRRLVPKEATLINCDISNTKKVSEVVRGSNFDLVMHFAGLIRVDESVKNPEKYHEYNYSKAKSFLDTCFKNQLRNVIFSSTASVYGNPVKNKVNENDKLNPLNPYALSKYNLERYLINQSKKIKINSIILRYFNVAGAEDKMRCGLISKKSTHLIKVACEVALKKRKELVINGDDYDTVDGTPIRDFIHISDLAEMHLLSAIDLINNKKSNIFNCGYGKGFSVKQVIDTLNKILNFKIQISVGKRRDGDSECVVADSLKFFNYFSWKPKYENLELILQSALEWEKKIN